LTNIFFNYFSDKSLIESVKAKGIILPSGPLTYAMRRELLKKVDLGIEPAPASDLKGILIFVTSCPATLRCGSY